MRSRWVDRWVMSMRRRIIAEILSCNGDILADDVDGIKCADLSICIFVWTMGKSMGRNAKRATWARRSIMLRSEGGIRTRGGD